MQQHFAPVFTATPHGIMMDGMPLNKSAFRNLPPETLHTIKRAEELLAIVKKEDWDNRTPHAMHNIPTIAKAQMMLALASPQPYPSSLNRQNWQELVKDARDGSEDDEGDDSEDDSSSGDSSDEGSYSGGGSGHYNPDEPRIPAGQPGGGQWTTGDGTTTDSGSISADDVRNDPTDTVMQVGSITPTAYTTTQAVSAPSFSDLWNNYPAYANFPTNPSNPGESNGEFDNISIWELISGNVDYNAATNPKFDNTCAIRLSYALNQSGYPIPYDGDATISGEMLPGDTTKTWYYFRVNDLADYLQDTYGAPNEYDPGTWKADLAGQTGIVLFEQHFKDANGHFELFNGYRILDYDNTRAPNDQPHDYSATAHKILFWPLK